MHKCIKAAVKCLKRQQTVQQFDQMTFLMPYWLGNTHHSCSVNCLNYSTTAAIFKHIQTLQWLHHTSTCGPIKHRH